MLIGRQEEIATLKSLKQSNEPAFVAVYGRRRVGKTYLIRQFFNDTFTFQLTGIANVELPQQLGNFRSAFIRYFPEFEDKPVAKDWFQAFQQLITALEADDSPRKTLFLDELPWLDNTKS
ncbi:MAG: AAA family ATPase, partial [Spirosomaceae bacterium]|nr:AAA family ATPase [Spirosomataceae bacterium]